jgi:quinol monooxygenase YgiN
MLMIGAPVVGLVTAIAAGGVDYLLGRETMAAKPKRPTKRSAPKLLNPDVPHQLISLYRVRPGTLDEAARQAQAGLAEVFRKRPGFIAFEVVRTGEIDLIVSSTWRSRAQAEAAVDTAVAWATIKLPNAIASMENHIGEILVSEREAPTSVAAVAAPAPRAPVVASRPATPAVPARPAATAVRGGARPVQ